LILAAVLSLLISCSVNVFDTDRDRIPPAPPEYVFSITGDNEVIIAWDENLESDLDYYVVYKSSYEDGPYRPVSETYDTYFVESVPNGLTFYFAVSAVDFHGNESNLSKDLVWDTPRPEGHNSYTWALIQYGVDDYDNYNKCGIDFSDFESTMIQSFDNSSNDIYFDMIDDQIFINVYNIEDTDISLFGQTEFLSDVDFVYEDTEWDESGYLPVIEDFSYIIWTWDDHFVTIRIEEAYDDLVIYSWAYQTDPGNPQLKISSLKKSSTAVRVSNPPSLSSKKQYLKTMEVK
ncbi:hypothetical protein ACFL4T_10675, partial [candidate division KSB1 bacterium]